MDNKKITITIPSLSVSGFATDLLDSYTSVKQKFQNLFILFYETGATMSDRTKRSLFHSMNSMGRGFNRFNRNKGKRLLMVFVPLLILVILVTVGVQVFRQSTQSDATVLSSTTTDTDIKATTQLNKKFNFPLLGDNGKEIGTFAYDVQSAELRDQIIVKGQRATAVKGRTFLIVNLQLKNSLKQGLEINSRDYVRLSVNGNKEELLAPEIHNDPVEVQAISTKFTRIGFAINDTDKNLVLIVGEIDGEKQEIPVKF